MAAVTTATAYAEVVSALDKSNAPEKEKEAILAGSLMHRQRLSLYSASVY